MITDTSVNGSTNYRWYKIRLDENFIYFMDSTDGTNWVTYQKFTRDGIMSRIPDIVLIGKGIFNPPQYKNYDWDNDYVMGGSLGDSFMDDVVLRSWGDGKDIVITSDDKKTKIDHEVSWFDPINGRLVFVCRASSLRPNLNNNFFVYYGNHKITRDQADPYSTWNTDWGNDLVLRWKPSVDGSMVQVLNYADSNHGVAQPSLTPSKLVQGAVGYAARFDGTNDYIRVPHKSTLNYKTATTKFTEVVFKMDSTQGGTILSKMGTDSGYQIKVDKTTGRFSYIVKHDAVNIHESYYDSSFLHHDNTFHSIEILIDRDNTKARMWIDDTEVSVLHTGPVLNTLKSTNLDSTVDLYVGCDNAQANRFLGTLGHIRISRNTRLLGWIKLLLRNTGWVKKLTEETFRISKSDLILDVLFRKTPIRPRSQNFIFTSLIWKLLYCA